MEQRKIYDEYQQKLHTAFRTDETAVRLKECKKYSQASTAFREAAEQYADSARIMLGIVEICDAKDLSHYQNSVEKLISLSKEMKTLADQMERQAETTESGAARSVKTQSPEEDGEELENEFQPVELADKVHLDDIVGLDDAKEIVSNGIVNPLLYKEVYEKFKISQGKGLLIFGPPGSGKTMLAQAIASEVGLPFFSIKCSDLVAKWFGESEKRISALFSKIRKVGNAIVFLDEAESIACRRGGNSTVMNRLVPELLAQMDGLQKLDGHIVFIFATNRPYDLDPAFLRFGRLSTLCYVPLPNFEIRKELLKKQFAMRPCEEGIDVDRIAQETENYSCADLMNLVTASCMDPINETIEHRKQGDQEWFGTISQDKIEKAMKKIHRSVDLDEIKKIEKWMTKMHVSFPEGMQKQNNNDENEEEY